MKRVIYYVSHEEEGWYIASEGKLCGPHATQGKALHQAIGSAYRAGACGSHSHVFMQGKDGSWRNVWSYGHDPYPLQNIVYYIGAVISACKAAAEIGWRMVRNCFPESACLRGY